MTSSTSTKHGNKESKRVKKEPKESKPLTKIIVRRLPPKLVEEEFLEAVDPIAEHDYFRFVISDDTLGPNAFARAYINFINVEDVFLFKEKFDGYVFIDRDGSESQCLVEYSAYQKTPNATKKTKKDIKSETIDEDPEFLAYKEEFENNEHQQETPETLLETIEKHEKETKDKETSTALLNHIKEKKSEKIRQRQEKFDQRKKRDEDRRKAKDDEKRKRKEYQKTEIAKNMARRDRDDDSIREPKYGTEDKYKRRDRSEVSNDENDDTVVEESKSGGQKKFTKKEKQEHFKEKKREAAAKRKEEAKSKQKEYPAQNKKDKYDKHDRYEGEGEGRPKTKGACFKCGEEGHIKADCPNRYDKVEKYDKHEKYDKQEGYEKSEKYQKSRDKGEEGHTKYEKSEKYEKPRDKTSSTDELETIENSEKPENFEKSEKPEKQEKAEKPPKPRLSDEDYEKLKQERKERREQRERERQERPRNKALNKERPAMQIYRPGMGKFSSQTITGKSDEGSEFATEFAGGNSTDESRSDSKQPDGNTGPANESGKKYSKTKTFRNSAKFEKGQKSSENSQNNRESKGESPEAAVSQDKKTHPTRETREAYPTRENREGPTRETREGSSRETREGSTRETREGSNRETREAFATREGYQTREFRRTNENFRQGSGHQPEFQKEKPKRHPPTPKQGSIPPEESRSPSASGSMENFDKFHKVATPPPAKKSGKSYASKRKERQQLKEKSKGQNPNDEGVLDLPSD